jgi:hypothetical protein
LASLDSLFMCLGSSESKLLCGWDDWRGSTVVDEAGLRFFQSLFCTEMRIDSNTLILQLTSGSTEINLASWGLFVERAGGIAKFLARHPLEFFWSLPTNSHQCSLLRRLFFPRPLPSENELERGLARLANVCR